NFERDLDHLAIAVTKSVDAPSSSKSAAGTLIFIAEGRFDRQKLSAYALRTGIKDTLSGHETFIVPLDPKKDHKAPTDNWNKALAFEFVSDHMLIASTGMTQLPVEAFFAPRKAPARDDWQQRFERLAGSPVFAVIRQDVAALLTDHAPGGLRSPQLSSLLTKLQWITIAAKPDADQLRLVAEGESASESTQRQL